MAAMDPRVICPLDPAHEIFKSRLQFHRVRCMKNHNLQDKWVCPYNAVHIVDKVNFQEHIANCVDYKDVQRFTYKTDDKKPAGILTVNEVNRIHNETADNEEENWDDVSNDTQHFTYDPWKASEKKAIVRVLIGATVREKREFRQQERMRIARLAEQSAASSHVKSLPKLQPLRPPQRQLGVDPGQLKPLRPPKFSGDRL